MTDYAKGGYIPGSVTVTLHPDECVIRRDGTCIRAEHAHTGPVVTVGPDCLSALNYRRSSR